MDDELLSAGVKIILERAKTNPEEMLEEYGKWAQLREAVFNYKENGVRNAWLRGLIQQDIDALFNMFTAQYTQTFDSWVMKTVLETGEPQEQLRYKATERYSYGTTDPRLFVNAAQTNSILGQGALVKPNSWHETTEATSNTSIATKIKQTLGI